MSNRKKIAPNIKNGCQTEKNSTRTLKSPSVGHVRRVSCVILACIMLTCVVRALDCRWCIVLLTYCCHHVGDCRVQVSCASSSLLLSLVTLEIAILLCSCSLSCAVLLQEKFGSGQPNTCRAKFKKKALFCHYRNSTTTTMAIAAAMAPPYATCNTTIIWWHFFKNL